MPEMLGTSHLKDEYALNDYTTALKSFLCN